MDRRYSSARCMQGLNLGVEGFVDRMALTATFDLFLNAMPRGRCPRPRERPNKRRHIGGRLMEGVAHLVEDRPFAKHHGFKGIEEILDQMPAINDMGCRRKCGGNGRRKATAPITTDDLDRRMAAEPCNNRTLGLVREEIEHAMGL